ncbi:MAG: hypothetical protein HUJ22_04065 [Gracilimonas sp.]|uniref:hypothetical protein n=1 Tax=Gracilimonas sp. TaxID=1974203 RepID=UPI0019BA1B55|nr:hypothetical protein [Gracilimonas sp.]MBD3615726.1 hypothetical protein [Gracilimonas sp.]
MDNRNFLITFFLFLLVPGLAFAQSDRYKLKFAPDLWYNNVDGIRVGARVFGEIEGTFRDGPHRLDAGVWLATNIPELPVSYYLSFTEPVAAISSYGNEGNIQIRSSIRTGYSHHQVSLNKRWQTEFNELKFTEWSLFFSQEKMFDADYRPYPQLWQTDWKSLLGMNMWLSKVFDIGKFDLQASVKQNLVSSASYTVGAVEVKQQIPLGKGFNVRLRGFSGINSSDAAPEYQFGRSYRQPVEWLNNGVTRAQGTLPNTLLDDGLFQIAGGANLRGYTFQDFEELANSQNPLTYNFTMSLNAEVEYPNPVNNLFKQSIIGDFVHLRSYVFGDIGRFYRNNYMQTPGVQSDILNVNSDAGLGFQFSLNIPDYLGKDRGFAIRYEIPFWLSHPNGNENTFKFRNLIGIGAVISL